MSVFLSRRMLLAAKIEASEGTAEALAGADANLFVENVSIEPDIDQHERQPLSLTLLELASVPGMRRGRVSFSVELKGSGTAGTAPTLAKLFKAAMMKEAIVVATSAEYTPQATQGSSLTIGLYAAPESGNNVKMVLAGCRVSSLSMNPRTGEIGRLQFTLQGVWQAVTDVAALVASGLETTAPPALLTGAFSLHGFSALAGSFTLDWGLSGTYRQDISKASGLVSYVTTRMAPTLAAELEFEKVADHDVFGKMLAATEGAFSVKFDGGAGNICTITAPKHQHGRVVPQDREGLLVVNTEGKLNDSVADDRLSLKFT